MRIEKSDLSNGKIAGLVASLETDGTDTAGLIEAIDSFITEINSAKNLSGESYKKVSSKLSEYKSILTKRKTLSSELSSAINSAVNSMKGYMEGYDVLDTDKLDSLNQSLSQAQTTINSLSESISKEVTSETKNDLKKQLNSASALAITLRKEIEKIEGLPTADSSAYASIEAAKSSISEYNSAISGVQESTIVSL